MGVSTSSRRYLWRRHLGFKMAAPEMTSTRTWGTFFDPYCGGGGKWRPFRFRSPSWMTSFPVPQMRSSKMAAGSGRVAIFHHHHNGDRKKYPILLSHTTVFTFSSVVFIRREETLTSLASTMYLLCQNWFGEHPRTTSCCLPIPIEIANTSLHTFRSDNMVCTISMKALAQFFSAGFKSQWHGSQPGRRGELSKKPGKSGWYRYICQLHLDIFLMNSNLQTGQICHIWLHTYSSLLLD